MKNQMRVVCSVGFTPRFCGATFRRELNKELMLEGGRKVVSPMEHIHPPSYLTVSKTLMRCSGEAQRSTSNSNNRTHSEMPEWLHSCRDPTGLVCHSRPKPPDQEGYGWVVRIVPNEGQSERSKPSD